jgi:hypothetical protein
MIQTVEVAVLAEQWSNNVLRCWRTLISTGFAGEAAVMGVN